MDSKGRFSAIFQRQQLTRPLYVPLVCSFAAKLRQISVQEMFNNPTIYANALREAHRLFGFDVLLTSFDPSLEAEALGCQVEWVARDRPPQVISHPLSSGEGIEGLSSLEGWESRGRIPTVFEVTRRLVRVLSQEVAVIGVLTGPISLARQLRGEGFLEELKEGTPFAQELLDFSSQCCLKMAQSYAELKVDGLLVIEDRFNLLEGQTIERLNSNLQPLANLLRYFSLPWLLLIKDCREELLDQVLLLPADAFILDSPGKGRGGEVPVADIIPTELLQGDIRDLREGLAPILEGFGSPLLSHEWEIPYHTPVQNVQEVTRLIRGLEDRGEGRGDGV